MISRPTRFLATIALSTVMVIGFAGTSGAGHWTWKFDGNDTGGPADLKRVGLKIPNHSTTGDKGVVSCRGDFYQDMKAAEVPAFYCYYDTKGDQQFEYGILGQWDGEKLTARAYKYKNGAEVAQFNVPMFMKDGDAVITLAKRRMHGRASHLNWRIYSYADTGDDNAPDAAGNYYKYKFP